MGNLNFEDLRFAPNAVLFDAFVRITHLPQKAQVFFDNIFFGLQKLAFFSS